MKKNKSSVLIVAAHPDDEVLGCGGTIAKLTKEKNIVNVLFISNGEDPRDINKKIIKKKIKKRKDAAELAAKILGATSNNFMDLSDNKLDTYPLLKIVKIIEKYIKKFKADTIYTHFNNDLNIDHQIVNQAVLTACRPQKIHVSKIYFSLRCHLVLNGELIRNQKFLTLIGLRIYLLQKIKKLKH